MKEKLLSVLAKNQRVNGIIFKMFNRVEKDNNSVVIPNIHTIHNRIIMKGTEDSIMANEGALLREANISITGNSNSVKIKTNTQIYGGSIHVDGNNNEIIIGESCRLTNITLFIWGDNNRIIIGDKCSAINAELHIEEHNNEINIGDGTTMHGRDGYPIHIAVDEASKVIIKKDCMLSNGIQIRSTDSHSIVSLSQERLNPAEDVIIGEHCWIGLNCIILKGTNIPSHSIVGAGSICSKKFEEMNCVIAGNPAKIVKHEVDWDRKFV